MFLDIGHSWLQCDSLVDHIGMCVLFYSCFSFVLSWQSGINKVGCYFCSIFPFIPSWVYVLAPFFYICVSISQVSVVFPSYDFKRLALFDHIFYFSQVKLFLSSLPDLNKCCALCLPPFFFYTLTTLTVPSNPPQFACHIYKHQLSE